MGYTPSFTPQYENGWEDLPLETTPITAEALNNYDDAIENIEEYLASDESQANLADAYSAIETYSEGDYRIHNGTLYKCLEDIDEPEEWDNTKWESCLITDEMVTSGVIANPSGQATETLTKLQVEETIYGISGGGGSANIWEGTQAELEEQFDDIPNETAIIVIDDEEAVDASAEIYSEDERLIGLWTDNKPLYQKTFVTEKTNIVGNSTINVNSEISSLNVDEVISYKNILTYTISGGSGQYYSDDIARLRKASDDYDITLSIGSATLATLKIEWTIQYTKSTDVPLTGVIAGKSTMYVASSDCYSTEEKEIGCAPNGKPLYQKTIIGTTLSGQTSDNKPHNISNLDEVIDAEVSCYFSSNGYWRKLNFAYNNGTIDNAWLAGFNINNTNIIFQVGNSFANGISKWYATIQYTKTTDTAGSGKFTPAGTQTEHYSTEEQVIGTWIDGKTLYRKIIKITSDINLTADQWISTGISASNIHRIIRCDLINQSPANVTVSIAIQNNMWSLNSPRTIQVTGVLTDWHLILEYTKTS